MQNRKHIRNSLALALIAGCCLALPACGSAAKVHVTKEPSSLTKYKVAKIEATGNGPELSRAARKFKDILAKQLKSSGLFKAVDSDGDVVFHVNVTNMEFGDEVKRELSLKGKAKVTAEIRITKPDGTLLGHITVVASASRKNAEDEPAVRVLERAAEKVVEYLQK